MFRLRLLGGLSLEGPSGTVLPPLSQRRAEAVLAVLAVCGNLGCTRERLLALLWPESDDARSRHGLRDSLHAIRRGLDPSAVPSGTELLRLDPTVVGSDVASFAEALGASRYADAVRAYGGPLLDGFHLDDAAEFEHWLDGERTRLAREYVEALKHLAMAAEGAGLWDQAVGWWARAVEHDPLNSHVVLQHVRALAATGDRANAIKAADLHARRLRDELDLEPDPEILAGIERIRRGEMPSAMGSEQRLAPASEKSGSSDGRTPEPTPQTVVVKRRSRRTLWSAAGAVVVVLVGALGVARWLRAGAAVARPSRTSIAVMPFRNLSADSSHAYFAGGLHDELLTQLARVASLKVIGRTSTRGYEETSKQPGQIGEELGVGSIVEASVQVDGSRLRVTVQLLDPVSRATLWAESYDRTLDDAFAVQSDIAQRIVAALGATLTSAEAGVISAPPTQSSEAYRLYLQGLDYFRRPGLLRQNFDLAEQFYERALALDSLFAEAHAALARNQLSKWNRGYDGRPARLEQARHEADVAIRLDPNLPQAHLAIALARYDSRGAFRESGEELKLGLRGAPSDPDLWASMGSVQRSLGNWDSAVVALDRARRLDPRNMHALQSLGDLYHFLHRYGEAIELYRLELALTPDMVQPHLSLAWSYILWKGQLDTLRSVLRKLPLDGDPGSGGGPIVGNHLALLLLERHPDSILALLRAMPKEAGASEGDVLFRAYFTAQAYFLLGDTAAARAATDTSQVLLDAAERARPDDWDVHSGRGEVLANHGRRAEAAREVAWLAHADESRHDRYMDGEGVLAGILVRAGEFDAALPYIEQQLASPSSGSVNLMRLDPRFDPIRRDPRFQALLAKYANMALPQ